MEKKKDGGKSREKSSLCETLQTTAIFSDRSPLSTMKRHGSSDSMAGFTPMCPTLDESSSPVGEFESILRDGLDEEGQILEKKRRLSVDQVKALEKNFELENKLEPERKVKLAHELGLQPRQVAVWFQNRRARWKTKQLERDYALLKSNFDSLKQNYDSLKHDNQSLLLQIRDLKPKLYGDDQETNFPFKQETPTPADDDAKSPQEMAAATSYVPDFKDGSSDSDSSAILNEDNNSSNMAAMADVMNCHQITESKAVMGDAQNAYQPQFVKIEEHNFFGGDESCNFFSDDQAPTLQWYCQDQWNLTEEN